MDKDTWNVSASNLAVLTKAAHHKVSHGQVELVLPGVWPYK